MTRSPSIIPDSTNRDVYLVLDDFGSLGRVWPETDEAGTNRVWMIRSLLEGQYVNPVRIVAFNIAEGWSRDVTLDIADELRRRSVEYDEVPASVLRFLETASRQPRMSVDACLSFVFPQKQPPSPMDRTGSTK